jgi:hypothetical protein
VFYIRSDAGGLGLGNTTLTWKKTYRLIAEGGPVNGDLSGLRLKLPFPALSEDIRIAYRWHSPERVTSMARLGHTSFRADRKLSGHSGMVEGIQKSDLRHGTEMPDSCACESC